MKRTGSSRSVTSVASDAGSEGETEGGKKRKGRFISVRRGSKQTGASTASFPAETTALASGDGEGVPEGDRKKGKKIRKRKKKDRKQKEEAGASAVEDQVGGEERKKGRKKKKHLGRRKTKRDYRYGEDGDVYGLVQIEVNSAEDLPRWKNSTPFLFPCEQGGGWF